MNIVLFVGGYSSANNFRTCQISLVSYWNATFRFHVLDSSYFSYRITMTTPRQCQNGVQQKNNANDASPSHKLSGYDTTSSITKSSYLWLHFLWLSQQL